MIRTKLPSFLQRKNQRLFHSQSTKTEKYYKRNRDKYIDYIRGIAFVLMIIHHIFYFRIFHFLPYKIPNWVEICGIISRNIFIILNGFVIAKYNSRTKEIFLNALIISLYSYIFLPKNNFIYMGVLHYLFFATCILNLFKKNCKIIILLFGYLSYKYKNIYFPIINQPADIFLPSKWFYKSVIGFILGYIFIFIDFPKSKNDYYFFKIDKLGKYSLYLYTLHMGLFMFLQNRF